MRQVLLFRRAIYICLSPLIIIGLLLSLIQSTSIANTATASTTDTLPNQALILNNYGNWTFGTTRESAFVLQMRLKQLAKRDRIVIPESAEWPNDVKGWSKLTPQSLKKLNPRAKVYRYVSLLGKPITDSDWDRPYLKTSRMIFPLTRAVIDANDWWLRDGNGNIVKEPGGKIWYVDVGKPGFKESWLKNVLERNEGKGFDGFVLDLMHPDITSTWFAIPGGWFRKYPLPKSYSTSEDWYRRAWQPFIEYVVDGLHKAGYEIIGNCAGEYGQSNERLVWQRSKLDGVIYEEGALDWNGSWLPGTEFERRMKAFSADPLKEVWIANGGIVNATPEFERKSVVALAMYYIALPENSARHSFNIKYSETGVWWDPLWGFDIGLPIGKAIKRSGKYFWIRKFTNGIVLLNYEENEKIGFHLPTLYKDHLGNVYSERIEVQPRSALILSKASSTI
jgi:hypothetical protein